MSLFAPGSGHPQVVELCRLLEQAERAVRAQHHDRLMDGFESNAEFADFLKDARGRITSDRLAWIGRRKLYSAFAPTGDWNDSVGDVALGNRIFALVESLYGTWR